MGLNQVFTFRADGGSEDSGGLCDCGPITPVNVGCHSTSAPRPPAPVFVAISVTATSNSNPNSLLGFATRGRTISVTLHGETANVKDVQVTPTVP